MKIKTLAFITAILFILSACAPVQTPESAAPDQQATALPSNPTAQPTEPPAQATATVRSTIKPSDTPTPWPSDVGSQSIGDTYYDMLGNGGYDVQKYTIRMDVDMKTGSLEAVTRIEAVSTQELRIFSLDFTGLEWDRVRVNDVEAQFERRIRKLVITPAEPLEKDMPFSVEVTYHGTPWTVTSVAGGTVGWFRAMDGTINIFTEPDGAYSWFPCNNHPRDKALYRFEITVDDPWVAAANGLLIETIPQENQTTYVFEMNEPMATYLATVNIDQYDLVTMPGPNDVQIRNYIPADFPEEKREVLQLLPEIMVFYNDVFGSYPSTVYGVLVMDENATHCATSPFGDETQSLTILCPRVVREVTFVHEMAHEWFGDSVSIENWQDLWVKEGMATYAGCLWDARDGDAADLNNCMIEEATDYPNRWPVDEPPPNNLFCSEAYTGGAMVYHSLHLLVGDEVFFDIVHTFLERYRGSSAGTDELIAVVEEVSGQELEDVIRAWLKNPEMPK